MGRFVFRLPLCLLVVAVCLPLSGWADTFVVVDSEGNNVEFEARLHGAAQGLMLLERATGRIEQVPERYVIKRTPGDDPTPITEKEMLQELAERFGGPDGDLFIGYEQSPYVVGIALQAPLDKRGQARATTLLKRKVAPFLKSLQKSFDKFATRMDLPKEDPRFPLVMMIFETDAMFEAYANAITGGRGLSATNITGFYSGLTNWLAVRMDECHDFALPLHEGIHQQVYNRGWFQRLAEVPVWFDEGIATGFEADGVNVGTDPRSINARYAAYAAKTNTVTFRTILEDDSPFRGDVLAGEAYVRAWALHWMLVGSRPKEYTAYVKMLGEREPLAELSKERRVASFEQAFNVSVDDLQAEFRDTLTREARLQRVSPPTGPRPGYVDRQDQMGHVSCKVEAIGGGRVRAQGILQNTSPLRPLVFLVHLEPDTGQGLLWASPTVEPLRDYSLKRRFMFTNSPGFRVTIRSALPDSEDAKRWQAAEQQIYNR